MNPYELITTATNAFISIKSIFSFRKKVKQQQHKPDIEATFSPMPKDVKAVCLSVWPDFGKNRVNADE